MVKTLGVAGVAPARAAGVAPARAAGVIVGDIPQASVAQRMIGPIARPHGLSDGRHMRRATRTATDPPFDAPGGSGG